jgi:uncharacterized protein (DUF1015 family)
MARIYPFRALRYNPAVARVEDCVTQPYDKITPSMQAAYYARSPYNLVRIILGLPELFDEPGVNDIYTRAARDFAEWRRSGVLAPEPEPCLFAYAQRFTVPGTGQTVERRGLIALGAVSPYSEGIVFRHEQTHTRARTDRLNLLRATRAHFGQIFMLYADPAFTVESLLFAASGEAESIPEIDVTDEFGVQHRVWKIDEPSIINKVQSALADKKLIIADGHHRYETALAYAAEHAPARSTGGPDGASAASSEAGTQAAPGGSTTPPYPEAAVMMTLVNMETPPDQSPGLHILPTHRIVRGLPSFDAAALPQKLKQLCTRVEPIAVDPGNATALLIALQQATEAAPTFATVLLAVTRNAVWALTIDSAERDRALPDVPPRRRRLDMVVLHEGILAQVLGVSGDAVKAGEYVTYAREAADALAPVLSGDAQIAFLVHPVTLEQLRSNTFAGEVMPQKSTDFYPKLLSGLAIYALDLTGSDPSSGGS